MLSAAILGSSVPSFAVRRARRASALLAAALGAAAVASACGVEGSSGAASATSLPARDRPIAGLTSEQTATFNDGNHLFDLALHEGDGLGPLYTRNNCSACHGGALRGPGAVEKMSVVAPDGLTPSPDQSSLPFGPTVHPLLAAGATTPIVPPADDPSVRVTVRVGPPVVGRGYMEAVEDSEIERMEAEQATRDDGIHGRVNRVVYASEANPDTRYHQHQKGDLVIGRFGLKARIATLDDFTADAAQGDMGITSPLRPTEIVNPDHLLDDDKPRVDVTAASINARADYMRLLAIPRAEPGPAEGKALFVGAKCAVCHAPALRTRADYPIAQLAGIDAEVYTDFLLHDMGEALSDSLEGADGTAHAREWRTAPLMGMSLLTTFLHDGRAKSLDEAIRLHGADGSEAAASAALYASLPPEQASLLVAFVRSL